MKKIILLSCLGAVALWLMSGHSHALPGGSLQCMHSGMPFGTAGSAAQCEALHVSLYIEGTKDHPDGSAENCFVYDMPISPDL